MSEGSEDRPPSADIRPLNASCVSAKTLLHQLLRDDAIDALVIGYRKGGRWATVWTSTALGGLAMAALKIFHDVSAAQEEDAE